MDGSGNSSLSHTGNWGRHRLDLNGDGVFTGTGELDDTRTHNVVNELTGRDTDSNATDNYNPTYDADGNMNDDGKDYTYVYDAFGRLKEVKTRGGSPALVTEYTYNGLNFRISWHYDANTSGTTDGSDPTYWFCLDQQWRTVATFRGSDSDPKERFVFHAAGLVGSGNSSYIDEVILRNKDGDTAWTSASDGTLEERLYYMHNWRHDVSLVVTSGSRIVEYAKYYSYGRPFGMPAGDCDSLGSITGNDFGILMNWIAAGSWDARGDVNSDGVLNATDAGLFPSEYMGTGVLSRSDVMNRTGYASYQHAPDLAGTKWHVRHRVLDSELGRWTRRDPLGYVDGLSLLTYVKGGPLSSLDSSGLRRLPCNTNSTAAADAFAACGPGHCDGSTCTNLVDATICPVIVLGVTNPPPPCPAAAGKTMAALMAQVQQECRNGCFTWGNDNCSAAFPGCACQNLELKATSFSSSQETWSIFMGGCRYDVNVVVARMHEEWEGQCWPRGNAPPNGPGPRPPLQPSGGYACAR